VRRGAALALLALGCAGLAAPERAWRERPYVWASAGRIELRSCRFATDAPVGVALARGATPAEAEALDVALRAWEGALPGLRFRRDDAGAIRVRFTDGPLVAADGAHVAGLTSADCRYDPATGRGALAAASIELARRAPPDRNGRERTLEPEERVGTLVHELGHALGAAGHAASSDDALGAGAEALRRAGRRALAGEPARSPALRALYAGPPGALLESAPLDEWRTAELDGLARSAREQRLDGPYLRAGEAVGRIFWRDAAGREWGFRVPGLAELAHDPTQLLLLAEPSPGRAVRP
jgi:hypothetical protein